MWHGYLLSGTGSNLYTKNVARVWRAQGHRVLLVCQEQHPEDYDFIDAVDDLEGREPCTLARPPIGEVLPVYVYDEYEGFTAKRFTDLDDFELVRYTERNVDYLAEAIRRFDPEAIITGHEVMGPYIAKEACEPAGRDYVAKLHGSALEYAVKLQERYLHFATEGLGAAKAVAGGSAYMVEEAASVVTGWRDRAHVVNPGCDVDLFVPKPRPGSTAAIGFVGKLIAAKGVHHLLLALGFTSSPGLSLTIVGYGGFEEGLRRLADALATGQRDTARAILEKGESAPLVAALATLETAGDEQWQRWGEVEVFFAGRHEHVSLARIVPGWEALLAPSVVPEAFGMVAAEAAACGVLPIVPSHSGIGEAGRAVEGAIGRPGLLCFDPADPAPAIARRIDAVLGLDPGERFDLGRAAAAYARGNWSWSHTAGRLLALAAD